MQPKKSIKFQTVNDIRKSKFDNLWHEGFRMTPLEKDEGEAPSWVAYIPYDYENSEEDEEEDSGPIAMGSKILTYEDSIQEYHEYLYQYRDNICDIIYTVVHRLFKMPRLGYSFYEFALWDKKQSAIDTAIELHGEESIRKAVLAHFKAQTFNELTRTLNAISEEEFDFLVYGIKPDEED